MGRKRVYEVVVHLTGKQITHLRKHYPKEWSFTRKLLTWYLDNAPKVFDKGVPVDEIISDADEYYVKPIEDSEASGFYLH